MEVLKMGAKELMKDRWIFLEQLVAENADVEEIKKASRDYSTACELYLITKRIYEYRTRPPKDFTETIAQIEILLDRWEMKLRKVMKKTGLFLLSSKTGFDATEG